MTDIGLTYIDDNIQLKTSGSTDFSSRAGEAEVAYKFKYFYKEDTSRTAKIYYEDLGDLM